MDACSWSAQLCASGFITAFSPHPTTSLHHAAPSALLLRRVLWSFWILDTWYCPPPRLYRPGRDEKNALYATAMLYVDLPSLCRSLQVELLVNRYAFDRIYTLQWRNQPRPLQFLPFNHLARCIDIGVTCYLRTNGRGVGPPELSSSSVRQHSLFPPGRNGRKWISIQHPVNSQCKATSLTGKMESGDSPHPTPSPPPYCPSGVALQAQTPGGLIETSSGFNIAQPFDPSLITRIRGRLFLVIRDSPGFAL